MKLIVVIFSILLIGCVPLEDNRQKDEDEDENIHFNVIRATTDEEDLSDVTVFCIDGVKYIAVPGIGMSVKYKSYSVTSDPVPETCINFFKK